MTAVPLPSLPPRAGLRQAVVDIVVSHIPPGDFTVAQVGAMAYADLAANHPDLLAAYQQMLAEEQIQEALRGRINTARLSLYRNQSVSDFQEASARFAETGDPAAFGPIMEGLYIIDQRNTRRRLREMNRDDCLFVAKMHTTKADKHLMRAAFWQALAQRIGSRAVGDVFAPEQVAALYSACCPT